MDGGLWTGSWDEGKREWWDARTGGRVPLKAHQLAPQDGGVIKLKRRKPGTGGVTGRLGSKLEQSLDEEKYCGSNLLYIRRYGRCRLSESRWCADCDGHLQGKEANLKG